MENENTNYPKVIAVDFDGCLCTNKWPEIGEENRPAINELVRRKAEGDKIILWTCRTDQQLDDAVLWCMNRGLKFDAINENLPDNKEKFGNDCRKVFAHEYWDDKAVLVSAQERNGFGFYEFCFPKPKSRIASMLEKIKKIWRRDT